MGAVARSTWPETKGRIAMMRKMLLAAAMLGTFWAGGAEADTTLRFVQTNTSDESLATLNGFIKKFEADNPGVKVELISIPWDNSFEKFATMIAAGDIPDVAEMPDNWVALYANAGHLENLEPYLDKWEHKGDLNARALELARKVKDTAYVLPYGFFVKSLFYNKKLFAEAGVTGPPKTMDEFMEAAKKVSALPGKFGYCQRGGSGGFNAWAMFGAAANGDNIFFDKDGNSTIAGAGWVQGFQNLIDIYKNGYAPKDAVNWGYKETVAGFYTGTCAMLDQDADALAPMAEHMGKDDFGVVPMPKGKGGKAFPVLTYGSWGIMAKSANKELAWKFLAMIAGPENDPAWTKAVGALPIYTSAEKDPAYADPKYHAWFESLSDKDIVPTITPAYLPEYGLFAGSTAIKLAQQALLGQITAEDMAKQWAEQLTKAQQKYLAK
jgi:multiple sugar transport system substrate-binding protein